MRKNEKRKIKDVHRIVAETFIPNYDNKPQVNHKDGIKINVEANNLEWVTVKENAEHRDNVLGKHFRGERCGKAKLTTKDVLVIKELLKNKKLTQKDIGEMYGVSNVCINYINTGKRWSHLC